MKTNEEAHGSINISKIRRSRLSDLWNTPLRLELEVEGSWDNSIATSTRGLYKHIGKYLASMLLRKMNSEPAEVIYGGEDDISPAVMGWSLEVLYPEADYSSVRAAVIREEMIV